MNKVNLGSKAMNKCSRFFALAADFNVIPKKNMTKKFIGIFSIVALFFVSSSMADYSKHFSEVNGKIRKGQSKQTIIELLGKPLEIKIIAKSHKFIWGPEEEFWDKIPIGTRLEVWKYEFSDGHLNLYFINEGDQLDYRVFAPKGVTY